MKKYVLLLPALLILTGCPFKVGVDQPTRDTVTDAATKFQDGLNKLGEGLSGLDPVGINRLLTDNADMRAKLERITRSLNDLQARGVIEVASRAVEIRVASYTGAFKVTGWVDNRQNWFWENRTFTNKAFSFGNENSHLTAIRTESQRRYGNDTFLAWDNIARAAIGYSQGVVLQYLGTNNVVPGPEFQSIDLNTRFGAAGTHKVDLEVTPTGADTARQWAIRFQIILKTQNEREEIVAEFDRNSAGNAPLNQPLPLIEQVLLVRTTS